MTTLAALKAQVQYPLPSDFFSSIVLKRGLDGDAVCTAEIMASPAFVGAQADCYKQVVLFPSSISEGGMTISKTDKASLLSIANKLYSSIGEEPIEEKPKIKFY